MAMGFKEVMAVNLVGFDDRNTTQEELADSARLSARYFGEIERADVPTSITILEQIADALTV